MKRWPQLPHTLNVENITFKMDALYCVKSRGLVKTNASLAL